jgi:hypothetical protein
MGKDHERAAQGDRNHAVASELPAPTGNPEPQPAETLAGPEDGNWLLPARRHPDQDGRARGAHRNIGRRSSRVIVVIGIQGPAK